MKTFILRSIDRYRERKYGENPPAESYSGRIRTMATQNWRRAVAMVAVGIAVTYLPLGTGPRDKYGWRRGGI